MSVPEHNCYNCGYGRTYTILLVDRVLGCSCLKRGIFRSKRMQFPPALTCDFWKPEKKKQ